MLAHLMDFFPAIKDLYLDEVIFIGLVGVDDKTVSWDLNSDASLRLPMLPCSYFDLELKAQHKFKKLTSKLPAKSQHSRS